MTARTTGYSIQTRFILVFALGIFIHITLAAQPGTEKFTFERISIPGVIRSTQIGDIVQDKDGILWIVGNGLYRYDGFKFTHYTDVVNSDVKLSGKEISTIYYDSMVHRLLIATRNFGLMQYDYSTNKISRLVEQQGLPIMNQLTRTTDGVLWAASFNNGLYYSKNDTLRKISYLPNRWPSSILADGRKLYVSQLTTVFSIAENKVLDSMNLADHFKDLPLYTRITILHKDRSGRLWIGTERQGLFLYDLSKRKFIRHFAPTQTPFYSRINRILEDHEGLIWILTKAAGVAVYDQSGNQVQHLHNDPSFSKSISADNCFSVLEDKGGIIWIGTTGDLNKYDRQKTNFKRIQHNPHDPVSLSDNMVRGVFEDRTGKIWIGTDGGFINLVDNEKNTNDIIKVKLPGDPLNYVPMYFLELNDRIMLVGSSLGLLQYDRVSKKFAHYAPLWEVTKNKMVRQLMMDGDNLYFIFTGSVAIYNLKTKEYNRYTRFGVERAFNASVMHKGKQNRIWIGVRGGIAYLDIPTREIKFVPFEKKRVRMDSITWMALSIQELDNKIYVGTFNTGLWEIDISDINNIPNPVNYTEANGLQNNTIYSTLPDDEGSLWLSSNNGIARFDPKTKKIVPFTVVDGLQDEEFNRLAFFKNPKGEMIFGGINGINTFHPASIRILDNEDRPVITGLVVSNPFVESMLNVYMPANDNMKFSYEQNYLRFNFSVPNYHEPRRFDLYYKLDQFDTKWNTVQLDNSANYPNLKPGDYTFYVKAVSLNGNEEIAQLSFTIVPPLWKTWWFILLSFFVIAFFVMTIIRSYVRKAQFDKHRLETLLKIRTYEIEQSREELRALNQKKDLIFSILSHDLRSPLTTLKGFLGILIDSSDFLSKDDIKKHAISIRNSVTNSLDLIDNTLFWSLSQMGNIQYNPSAFLIRPVIEKVTGLYQLTAEKKMIRVSLNCDEGISIYADDNMIYVTLRNILSNAIKFTREGKSVNIRCTRDGAYARIEITDEGIGMSPDYLNKVLSMDQPLLKKGTSNEKGTGLGLLLCKKFLEVNQGKLDIKSTEGYGTTFIVTLPLANSPTT